MALSYNLLLLLCIGGIFTVKVSGQNECYYENEGYRVEWLYDPDTKMVDFDLTAAQPRGSADFWTAIAFGPGMWDLDAIVVQVLNGQTPTVSDMYAKSYGPPQRDANSHVQVHSATILNGVVNARFSRLLETNDNNDKSLSGCQKFYFPQTGGPLNGRTIGQHFATPVSRDVCNIDEPENGCVKSSPTESSETKPDTTSGGTSSSQVLEANDCNFRTENYDLKWEFDGTNVNFELDVKPPTQTDNYWTGVGIGESMTDLDLILVLVDNNLQNAQIADYYSNSYSPPSLDGRQDVIVANNQAEFINGRIIARFSRSLDTGDTQDNSLLGCITLKFPISTGKLSEGPRIQKHLSTPLSHSICNIDVKCRTGAPIDNNTPSPQPPPVSNGCARAIDLEICENYFTEYYTRVDKWAIDHGFEPNTQYQRACKLLAAVPGVQTYCCNRFTNRCQTYGPF